MVALIRAMALASLQGTMRHSNKHLLLDQAMRFRLSLYAAAGLAATTSCSNENAESETAEHGTESSDSSEFSSEDDSTHHDSSTASMTDLSSETSSSTASTTVTTSSSNSSSGSDETCPDAQPLMQTGPDGTKSPSGFQSCNHESDWLNRIEALACTDPQGVGTCLGDDASPDVCTVDSDCDKKPFGICNGGFFEGGFATSANFDYCGCHYGCESDADCDEGFICLCAGILQPLSQCVPASCKTNLECATGRCEVSREEKACGPDLIELACRGTANDTCTNDAQCTDECESCLLDAERAGWICRTEDAKCTDCGRPLVVDGVARVAPIVANGQWSRTLEPFGDRTSKTPTRHRATQIAAYWRKIAQLEHASIASFARFSLELMALSAPPKLLSECTQAMSDEIRHAQLAFGIAEHFDHHVAGPGPLDLGGLLDRSTSGRDILSGILQEACVGETLSAFEAAHLVGLAQAPMVVEVLRTIAADEERHAAFGWVALRWYLETQATGKERGIALATLNSTLAALQDELREPITSHTTQGDGENTAYGLPSRELRAQIRREGLRTIVVPALTDILVDFDASARQGKIGQDARLELAVPTRDLSRSIQC
jgi:hypothetical protein